MHPNERLPNEEEKAMGIVKVVDLRKGPSGFQPDPARKEFDPDDVLNMQTHTKEEAEANKVDHRKITSWEDYLDEEQ